MDLQDRREAIEERLEPTTRLGAVVKLFNDTYEDWRDGRVIRLGASLAYYGLFSVASALALTLSLSYSLLGTQNVKDFLAEHLTGMLGEIGPEATEVVNQQLADASGGLGIVGIISLVVTGSLFFLALQDALNYIWGNPVRAGLKFTILRRLLAALVLLAGAGIIVASVAIQAVTGILGDFVPDTAIFNALETVVSSILSWVSLVLAIVLLFRYVPRTDVPWKAAIVGGGITSAVMIVGTSLIAFYMREYATTSLSGAAGSIFVVLIWIFYEAQMLLAGAQLTKSLSDLWSPTKSDDSDGDDSESDDAED